MILTVEQFRAMMADDVAQDDDSLRIMLDANEETIEEYAGPIEEFTETFWGAVPTAINLKSEPVSVTSVAVRLATVDYDLDVAEDIEWDGNVLRLKMVPSTWGYTYGGWGEKVTVTYVPRVRAATRIMVLKQLMELDLSWAPGIASQSAGPWQESYTKDHLAQRERILERYWPRQVFA